MWWTTFNIDYHVEVDHHFYSVPYQLMHEHVEARFTQTTVELFFNGRRRASHARLPGRGRFSTQLDHMPRAPRGRPLGTPAASGAGLPRVPRADAARACAWGGSPRRRVSPRRAAGLLS